MIEWIYDIPYYLRKAAVFTKELPFKIWDKTLETYGWLSVAMTNWDMDLRSFVDQLVDMTHKVVWAVGWLVGKARYIVSEFINLIRELISSLRGWQ